MNSNERPQNDEERTLRARVWSETRGQGATLLTWARPTPDEPDEHAPDEASDARAVAATIGVLEGVASAVVVDGGVLVNYEPDKVSRPQLANAVRAALSLDADLKARGNELMKRVPAYLGLAKSLALDERVSPIPQAARQAAVTRAPALPAAGALPIAGRFIPGFPLVLRLHTLVPVLRSLASWSREASPEAVNEHLERAGLTRELLDRDLATSQEAIAFARDHAAETASKAVTVAASAAAQARAKARELARQYNDARKSDQ